MGMGQQHVIDLVVRHGQGCVFIHIVPLLHAAVHQKLCIPNLQIMTAAGNLMVRPNKCQLHLHSPLYLHFSRINNGNI